MMHELSKLKTLDSVSPQYTVLPIMIALWSLTMAPRNKSNRSNFWGHAEFRLAGEWYCWRFAN